MTYSRRTSVGLCVLLVVGAAPSDSGAQEGGINTRFDFGQSLVYEEGDLTTGFAKNSYLRTDLGFFLDQTRSNSATSLGLGAAVEIGDESATNTIDLRDPFIRFEHDQFSATQELGLNLSYDRRRIRDTIPDADFDDRSLVFDAGDRELYGAGLEFSTTPEVVTGLAFSADYRKVIYRDTRDPTLRNEENYDLAISAPLRIDKTRTLTPLATYFERRVEDAFPRDDRRRAAGLGYRQDVNEIVSVNAELRYVDRLVQNLVGGRIIPRSNSGPAGSLGVDIERPDGTWRALFRSTLLIDGRRRELGVNRNIAFTRSNLNFGFGVGDSDNADPTPLFDIAYDIEGPRSNLRFSAFQNLYEDLNNQETKRTGLAASYISQINNVSSWEASLNFGRTERLTGLQRIDDRTIFDIAYRHALTKEWDLRAAYQHQYFAGNVRATETARKVTLSVDRSFFGLR